MRPPLAIGHEIVGRVSALGPEAAGVAIGDRRIVFPWLGCGSGHDCLAGRDKMCAAESRSLGIRCQGGFAAAVVVPHPRDLVDPRAPDPALAAAGKRRPMPVTEQPMDEVNAAMRRLVDGHVQGRLVLRAESAGP